jgi:hypothetical protein
MPTAIVHPSCCSQQAPLGAVVTDVVLLGERSTDEWMDRILFVPF